MKPGRFSNIKKADLSVEPIKNDLPTFEAITKNTENFPEFPHCSVFVSFSSAGFKNCCHAETSCECC